MTAVHMRVERDALFLDLAQRRERKHLEPAAVREDRAVPSCETVQTAEFTDQLVARTHMQMVRVAQHLLAADGL